MLENRYKTGSNSPIRLHYQSLYSNEPPRYYFALQKLLPESLRNNILSYINSNAFLSVEVLDRLLKKTIDESQKLSKEENIVLADIGCGRGNLGRYIGEICQATVVGIDWSVKFSKESKRLICADICNIPIRNESINIAIAIDSIYMVDDVMMALHECRRILKPFGLAILSIYDRIGLNSKKIDKSWWLNAFCESSFKIEEWLDCTEEWKTIMEIKHKNRLNAENDLLEQFGYSVLPELDVSRKMLGNLKTQGFLDVCSRWEVTLRAI